MKCCMKICTISMDSRLLKRASMESRWSEIQEKINAVRIDTPNLYLLPEASLSGLDDERLGDDGFYVKPDDEYWRKFSVLAKKCDAYIAAAILTLREGKRRNSIVVFDRKGKSVFIYDKAHPTQPELDAGIVSGSVNPPCFESEFGKIGFAICFDLNFRRLFENYAAQEMNLLLFSTYFPGGRILSNYAFDFSCFAVSSHAQGDESVFIDNFGRETARANMFTSGLTREINLNSAVVPISGNLEKIKELKREFKEKIEIEIHRSEARIVITMLSSDNVDDIQKRYDFNLDPCSSL